jgi:hypothetical protein
MAEEKQAGDRSSPANVILSGENFVAKITKPNKTLFQIGVSVQA